MDFSFKDPALLIHSLIHAAKTSPDAAAQLEHIVVEKSMYNLHSLLVDRGVLKPNTNMSEALLSRKNQRLGELQALRQSDPDNESHVFCVDKQISELYAQTMDAANAFDTMKKLVRDTTSLSLRMDIFLCKIRMSIIMRSKRQLEESIEQAEDMCARGCDWDRRNKYKVYKAVFSIMKARFGDAAQLLSEALPSFESSEVVSYSKAVTYLVFCGLVAFDRGDVRDKIVLSGLFGSAQGFIWKPDAGDERFLSAALDVSCRL